MIIDEEEYLEHYGTLHKSGRYPWGSGENALQGSKDFRAAVSELRDKGLSDTEIATGFGMTTSEFRKRVSITKDMVKREDIDTARKLKAKGMSNEAIGRQMGKSGNTIKSLLKEGEQDRVDVLGNTAELLRQQVAQKGFVDVGKGVELHLNISKDKLSTAVALLEKDEGYVVRKFPIEQLGTGHNTIFKVLAAPGTTYADFFRNKDKIQQVTGFTEDGGRSFLGLHPPISIHPDRVAVRYGDEGGVETDGVIYVRPGVKDVSLGESRYAQVRVMVGDGHYLKGMAMYKNDLPDGVDLVFNTNKSNTGNKLDAMKPITDDPDNPFGAIVRQIVVRESDGKEFLTEYGNKSQSAGPERVTSAMNIVNREGEWGQWSKTLSSQMLSKQTPHLAKQQLDMTHEERVREFDEISSLTNPVVRRKLLEAFGDETDSAAVHLKAKALSQQQSHVILPIDSMPPTQVYAPNFTNGDRVVLIRYPHGGTFEIPELIVNNRQPEAKALIGSEAKDAIGIHHSVAQRLSGADFDGDTVLVIPNRGNQVLVTPALERLRGFEPKIDYAYRPGIKVMPDSLTQREMGDISNLITDMTIKGASTDKIARAVKHSMVVIDAARHKLDYQRSAKDNGIAQLKEEFQGRTNAGAATLISRARSEARITRRTPRKASEGGPIDPATGKRVYVDTTETYVNKSGKTVHPTMRVPKLAITDDAFTLVSGTHGTPMERLYASHSNKLKALANRARKDAVNTPNSVYNASAAKVYSEEVKRLNAALNLVDRNRPLERQAQVIANAIYAMKRAAHPDMDKVQIKRTKAQALNEARVRTGAKKTDIIISDREWEAIQAGAFHTTKLRDIIDSADLDRVRELAAPRRDVKMTTVKTRRAQQMLAAGYTRAEVAQHLGVSLSTLDNATSLSE